MDNASPGKAVYLQKPTHAAIIIKLIKDSDKVKEIEIAESNWASGWEYPKGEIPWKRSISTRIVKSTEFEKWKIANIDNP